MLDITYRYDPARPTEHVYPADGAEALRALEKGNREFAELINPLEAGGGHHTLLMPLDLEDLGVATRGESVLPQRPFAVVLGCSDARVPTEMVFHQGCNDLFVVRVAGNVLGSECLGSIDYALHHLGESIKLVVVLGHSGCGAVTAAVDAFLNPASYLGVASSHPLRAVVDRLLLPVRAAAQALEQAHGAQVTARDGYRRALIEATVALNAALTAATLHQEFRGRLSPHIDVVYGVYNLLTRRVQLPMADAGEVRLAHSSDDLEGPERLARELAGCDAIQGLLGAPGSRRIA
jgi:carbonic anhydrase